jgi:hypothetical protein
MDVPQVQVEKDASILLRIGATDRNYIRERGEAQPEKGKSSARVDQTL